MILHNAHLMLATSTEARFETLVTLLAGVLAILAAVGGFIWRTSLWIKRQADATRANTRALMGAEDQPGLIETVAEMGAALERLTVQLQRRGHRGRGRL
jgi:hypothetical protein